MIDFNQLQQIAKDAGFTCSAALDPLTIRLREDVRRMCADNLCRQYNRRWCCPPGCGTLDECRRHVAKYSQGILVQTIGEVEDSFDYEAMRETEAIHKANFCRMLTVLRQTCTDLLPLGAGSCTYCADCTYPDAPCRFPDKMTSSMEAYGIMVMDVCKANGMQYYYGSDKISYISCFLL